MRFFNEAALAQNSQVKGIPADAVLINANENPLGPCKEALEAAHKVVNNGGGYKYDEGDKGQENLAEQEGGKLKYGKKYAGSRPPPRPSGVAFRPPHQPPVAPRPDER